MSNGKRVGLIISICAGVLLITGGILAIVLLTGKKTFEVTFNSNGGTAVEMQKVKEGSKVTKPANPTKENNEFVGWYLNSNEYNFNTEVKESFTLTAKWQMNPVTCSSSMTEEGITITASIIGYFEEDKINKVSVTYEFAGTTNIDYYCSYIKESYEDAVCEGNKITIPDGAEILGSHNSKIIGMTREEFINYVGEEEKGVTCK